MWELLISAVMAIALTVQMVRRYRQEPRLIITDIALNVIFFSLLFLAVQLLPITGAGATLEGIDIFLMAMAIPPLFLCCLEFSRDAPSRLLVSILLFYVGALFLSPTLEAWIHSAPWRRCCPSPQHDWRGSRDACRPTGETQDLSGGRNLIHCRGHFSCLDRWRSRDDRRGLANFDVVAANFGRRGVCHACEIWSVPHTSSIGGDSLAHSSARLRMRFKTPRLQFLSASAW